ncbi:MAG: antitoxin [Proteobacteria bacterium]|nr:antitoxin [Pseudomonadota bacterium]MBU1716638.1 antitoxin [Pseudomonadota bacterium]
MATLQVRSIDDQLYEALGKLAARDHRSISQEVVAILKEYLSQPVRHTTATTTDEFLSLCGTWKGDRSAEEIADEIRAHRQSATRFQDTL